MIHTWAGGQDALARNPIPFYSYRKKMDSWNLKSLYWFPLKLEVESSLNDSIRRIILPFFRLPISVYMRTFILPQLNFVSLISDLNTIYCIPTMIKRFSWLCIACRLHPNSWSVMLKISEFCPNQTFQPYNHILAVSQIYYIHWCH